MELWIHKTICGSVTLFTIICIFAVVNIPTYYLIDKPQQENYVEESCPVISYTEQSFHDKSWKTLVYYSPSLGINKTIENWSIPRSYFEECDSPNNCVKCCYLHSDPIGTFGIDGCYSLKDPGGATIIYIAFNIIFGFIAEVILVGTFMILCRTEIEKIDSEKGVTKQNNQSEDVDRHDTEVSNQAKQPNDQSEDVDTDIDSYSLDEISTHTNNEEKN